MKMTHKKLIKRLISQWGVLYCMLQKNIQTY